MLSWGGKMNWFEAGGYHQSLPIEIRQLCEMNHFCKLIPVCGILLLCNGKTEIKQRHSAPTVDKVAHYFTS